MEENADRSKAFCPLMTTNKTTYERERVLFVQPKEPDWNRIAEICNASVRANRWANFGPVSDALAATVASILCLPNDRAVVVASSATTALQAVAGLHAIRAGRPLKWLISAFGFFSTAISAFANRVSIVDCTPTGMLDLEAADRVDPDEWDGLIVTNVFGLFDDLSSYAQFCADRGKRLIVDSAVSFPGKCPRTPISDEVISFHHTKPWGFGEGGCAIIQKDAVAIVKSFLNFGVGHSPEFAVYATNGKLSDLAAAAILARLECLSDWKDGYVANCNRIRVRCAAAGVATLGKTPNGVISAHVPVLAHRPTQLEEIPPVRFDVNKYYRPLAPGHPMATKLYEHMINVPCHPGMSAISDAELDSFFQALKGRP
jgi:dTDP-4-amino-4,6-dideoxygalactose transaminase